LRDGGALFTRARGRAVGGVIFRKPGHWMKGRLLVGDCSQRARASGRGRGASAHEDRPSRWTGVRGRRIDDSFLWSEGT